MDLQQRLDPEVWAGIVGRFVGILVEGVRRFGGTVDKFTGDGIMALFGAPVAQEDHARRACRAALHLTKAIAGYAGELRAAQGVDLGVRLGLDSGEVVVGRVGEETAFDPTALGHTVGLAQRMEAIAEPGTAYLTEHTAGLVEGWFRLRPLGPQSIKGASAPLGVYRLEGESGSTTGLRGGTALGSASLVGREREWAALEDALAAAAEGHAQVVGVVGQAGVGKSRLCEEFARSVIARGLTLRRSSGVSHGREVPLLPVLALLRDYFDISDADEPAQARAKVTGRVVDLDPGLEGDLPLLLDFLEVADPARPAPPLAPEVRMRRIFETLRRMTKRRSEQEVLVLLVEDLHWFDPQSEAFLERLIESYPGSRTLVITNFRPEFSAHWMRHSYYRQIPVSPLGDTAVGKLLGDLLGVDLSLAPLLAFVQERTGGIPFFVEEVVRALLEDGTLEGRPGHFRLTRPLGEVQVPPSVQAVLAARIDRLPPEHKSVLQTAAVIGRSFSAKVLAAVAGSTAAALEDALSALCAAELLQETDHDPAAEFRFWHPLTQEVAYGSLLSERRCQLHTAVARALIELDPAQHDERAALIGAHFEQAGNTLEAGRWTARAGNWSLRTDLAGAQRRWRRAVDLLAAADETPESLALRVRTLIRLIQFGARTGSNLNEVERLVLEGRRLAERLGDLALLTMVVFFSGTIRLVSGDVQEGLRRYLEAVRLGEPVDDPGLQSVLAYAPALVMGWTGPLDEALVWADRSCDVLTGDPDEGVAVLGFSQFGRVRAYRAMVLARAGRLGEAIADADFALEFARPRVEPENVVFAIAVRVEAAYVANETEGALALAEEAVRLGEETGNTMSLVFGLASLTLAHLLAGDAPAAVEAGERAVHESRSHRTLLCIEAALLTVLARSYLAAGDHAGAAKAADEAIDSARARGTRVHECDALLARAQLRRAIGSPGETVESDLQAALQLVADVGASSYEPFIHEELGRLHDDPARLARALELYRRIGATGHLLRLKAELKESRRAAT